MLLTIAIPTYNRAEYLISTLKKLVKQVAAHYTDRIEILVSDNASTDHTQTICQEFQFNNPGIVRYVRQPINYGFDRNLEWLFSNALGRYVLLIGDDDYPIEGTLERVCKNLSCNEHGPIGIYYCYHRLIDGDTGMINSLKEDFFESHDISGQEVVLYPSGIELLRKIAAPLNGGLTGTIFLRSAWLNSKREVFFGTNFLHLAVAYQIAVASPVCIDHRPSFVIRMFSTHRWPINGELYFGLLKAGQPLYELYPTDIVNLLRRKNDWAVRRAIISYRASRPSDRQLRTVIQNSLDRNRLGFWLIDVPLLTVPGKLFTFIARIIVWIKLVNYKFFIKRALPCNKD